MTEKIDWAAPINPGRSMLGLTLGLSLSTMRALLGENGSVVTFSNSPRLTVDYSKDGLVLLRAVDLGDCAYDWQNIVARLAFTRDELTSMIVQGYQGNEPYAYKGELFGRVGLGSPVSDLLDFGSIEYDDVEEVFFSGQWNGIEIGGSAACNLSANPTQLVTFFKVYG